MTCILGLVQDGKVYMGGDRAGVDGWRRLVSAETKVFKVGELLVGCSGTGRMRQLIHYKLALSRMQNEGENEISYLMNVFADEVRKLFAENGIVGKDNENEDKFFGSLLIGYRGGLYGLNANFQIDWLERPFDAIGSGSPFALGAMEVLQSLEPIPRIRMALRAAEALCCDVSAPFDILGGE